MATLPNSIVEEAVTRALAEDASQDDITTRWSVPEGAWAEARLMARQDGVLAGVPVLTEVFRQVDAAVEVRPLAGDGARLRAGEVAVTLRGPARSLLTGERAALNFLQRMSGIATLTSRFVATVADLPVRILDTRKTAPGLRALDKYAVVTGGGTNHRLNLAAMVLLKENHIAMAGGVSAAIKAVRAGMVAEGRQALIDVEVRSLDEAEEALRADASWIMLDNMAPPALRQVVDLRARIAGSSPVTLEASGNVTLETVRAIAETGVDAISVGALTHSVTALDLTLLLTETER